VAGKRLGFWVAVAGVSILANFGLELAAEKFPNLGFREFTAFTHRGVG
jgi:hypothetical protein